MGYYQWYAADNDDVVTAGAGGVVWAGVIQEDDGYGGYNTRFAIAGKLGEYHIHFAAGGTRVKCFRHKRDAVDARGTDLLKFIDGRDGHTPLTLADLIGECRNYPNFKKLFEHAKFAIKDVKRKPNGELSGDGV
ncbi:hypothetical protein [Chitinibacter sp. S2-10]|uniref:hypothetical protein n=1 Tax=Chitinibacter sp. S2-10 TaxID=3373597 RepID=UPI003977CD69